MLRCGAENGVGDVTQSRLGETAQLEMLMLTVRLSLRERPPKAGEGMSAANALELQGQRQLAALRPPLPSAGEAKKLLRVPSRYLSV